MVTSAFCVLAILCATQVIGPKCKIKKSNSIASYSSESYHKFQVKLWCPYYLKKKNKMVKKKKKKSQYTTSSQKDQKVLRFLNEKYNTQFCFGRGTQTVSVCFSFFLVSASLRERERESSWVGLLAMEALPSASHKTRYHILCCTKRGHFRLLDFLCFDYNVFLCVPVGSKF